MANSQDKIFIRNYDDFKARLSEYVNRVINEAPSDNFEEALIGYLVDLYTDSFYEELEYILNELGLELDEVEYRNSQNSINQSGFARSNYTRLKEIFASRKADILSIRDEVVAEKGRLDQEEIDRRIVPIIELISVSEVHMAIEKASVETAKVLHHITGEVIYKRWNSVNDERTCPICRLLDGTRVPVGISFIEGLDPEDDAYDIAVNYLSYTGGDFSYAHPRCRCWLTYEKEEVTL